MCLPKTSWPSQKTPLTLHLDFRGNFCGCSPEQSLFFFFLFLLELFLPERRRGEVGACDKVFRETILIVGINNDTDLQYREKGANGYIIRSTFLVPVLEESPRTRHHRIRPHPFPRPVRFVPGIFAAYKFRPSVFALVFVSNCTCTFVALSARYLIGPEPH